MASGSLAELRTQLAGYNEQLKKIEELIQGDPSNGELLGTRDGLREVITLTEELIAAAQAEENPDVAQAVAAVAAEGEKLVSRAGTGLSEPLPDAVLENMDIKTEKPGVSSSLPRQIQVQLRERGIEMALAGEAGFDPAWLIGEAIDAVFSEDGGWYPARVIGTSGPNYIVEFDGYEDYRELVRPGGVRRRKETDAIYKPVEAPKRRAVLTDTKGIQDTDKDLVIPDKYKISEADDEQTKEKKRKAIKAIKKEHRFAVMDKTVQEKANAWKKFQNTKGAKRAKGFMTGVKKTSIFKTDDKGKVGVTGSGKGVTQNPKRARHEYDVLATDE